jgi:hypothetical protein
LEHPLGQNTTDIDWSKELSQAPSVPTLYRPFVCCTDYVTTVSPRWITNLVFEIKE